MSLEPRLSIKREKKCCHLLSFMFLFSFIQIFILIYRKVLEMKDNKEYLLRKVDEKKE